MIQMRSNGFFFFFLSRNERKISEKNKIRSSEAFRFRVNRAFERWNRLNFDWTSINDRFYCVKSNAIEGSYAIDEFLNSIFSKLILNRREFISRLFAYFRIWNKLLPTGVRSRATRELLSISNLCSNYFQIWNRALSFVRLNFPFFHSFLPESFTRYE